MPQIQVRRGTTAQWTAANPILAAGEPGYDTTLELFKIGNGTSHWLDLPAGEGMSEADADARYAPVSESYDRSVLPLRSSLDTGRAAAFTLFGDSSGDSDGALHNGDGTTIPYERFPILLAKAIGAAYPDYHVMAKTWNPNTEDHGKWITLQAKSAGRRYATLTGRSLRYIPPIPAESLFTTGNMDLRVLVRPNSWAPGSGGSRALVCRYLVDNAGTLVQDITFRWLLKQDGHLALSMSTNGSSYNENDYDTGAPVTGVDGTALWLRATLELTPGAEGNITVKMWQSPADDGIEWTQVGSTLSYGGARSALYQNGNAFFEVGGEGWQPAGSSINGRLYEMQIRDGLNGPCLTPCLPELWQRYVDDSTSYGGAPTLLLINNSRSGSTMAYHSTAVRLKKETPDYGQLVSFFNTGHNEGSIAGQVEWLNPYKAWTEAVQHRLPTSTVAAVGQNPHTAAWPNELTMGSLHIQRVAELSAAAARYGWGYLDLYRAFLTDSRGVAALILPDGLHPNEVGYEVGGVAASKFTGLVNA